LKTRKQNAHIPFERLTGFQEGLGEQVAIQEILVRLASAHPEARQVGELPERAGSLSR
jgi:hypothetical protein